jgi:hypothetical protein
LSTAVHHTVEPKAKSNEEEKVERGEEPMV